MIEFMYWEQSPALHVDIWNNHALINLLLGSWFN